MSGRDPMLLTECKYNRTGRHKHTHALESFELVVPAVDPIVLLAIPFWSLFQPKRMCASIHSPVYCF
jgi:hypothetical protein